MDSRLPDWSIRFSGTRPRRVTKQPGLENACILRTSTTIGPRESRQIVGAYRLSGSEVNHGKKFDDSVARGSWWIGIHCPLGNTYPIHLCIRECPKKEKCAYWSAEHEGEMLYKKDLYAPKGDWYSVPCRSLVAKSHTNVMYPEDRSPRIIRAWPVRESWELAWR